MSQVKVVRGETQYVVTMNEDKELEKGIPIHFCKLPDAGPY